MQRSLEALSNSLQLQAPCIAVIRGPDGERVAVSRGGSTIRVYSAATKQLEWTLEAHKEHLTCLAAADDGAMLVSAARDGTVCLWNASSLQTGPARSLQLDGQSEAVLAAVSSGSDVRRIAAGGKEKLCVWELGKDSLDCLSDCVFVGRVQALSFSWDGRTLVSGGNGTEIWVWGHGDKGWTLLKQMNGHTAPVRSLALTRDGKILFSAGEDRTVRRWELNGKWKQLALATPHADVVVSIALSHDGSSVYSCSKDKTIKQWAPVQGGVFDSVKIFGEVQWETRDVAGAPSPLGGLAVSKSGAFLAAVTEGEPRSIRLVALPKLGVTVIDVDKDGKPVHQYKGEISKGFMGKLTDIVRKTPEPPFTPDVAAGGSSRSLVAAASSSIKAGVSKTLGLFKKREAEAAGAESPLSPAPSASSPPPSPASPTSPSTSGPEFFEQVKEKSASFLANAADLGKRAIGLGGGESAPDPLDPSSMDVDNVCKWLAEVELEMLQEPFRKKKVDGKGLLGFTGESLQKLLGSGQGEYVRYVHPLSCEIEELKKLMKSEAVKWFRGLNTLPARLEDALLMREPARSELGAERIGKGAFGEVFKVYIDAEQATAMQLKRPVAQWRAVKRVTYDSTKAAPLRRELHGTLLQANCEHENVMPIEGAFRSPNPHSPDLYVVMPLAPFGSLRKFLNESEKCRLPYAFAVEFGQQLANGMKYLHGKGIVHRDLKPENVLLLCDEDACRAASLTADKFTVRIGDFGIAHNAGTAAETRMGGTAYYMPPETQGGYVAETADVWAFAVTMVELVTGEHPHKHYGDPHGPVDLKMRPFSDEAMKLLPPSLSVLRICLHPEQKDRPTFEKILAEFERLKAALSPKGAAVTIATKRGNAGARGYVEDILHGRPPKRPRG